ncbi:MAG: hypothetical protein S4CHLAM6_06090 [Chlamydiae bacterium]|nr:hypothetical protein [Chlamydiota bacterium]
MFMAEFSISDPQAPTSGYCDAMHYIGNSFEMGGFALAMTSSFALGAQTMFIGRFIKTVDNVVCRGSGWLDAVWGSPKELAIDLAKAVTIWGHYHSSRWVHRKAKYIRSAVEHNIKLTNTCLRNSQIKLSEINQYSLKSYSGGTTNFLSRFFAKTLQESDASKFRFQFVEKITKATSELEALQKLLVHIQKFDGSYNSIITSFNTGFFTAAAIQAQNKAKLARFENLYNNTFKQAKALNLSLSKNATLDDLASLTNNQIFIQISKLIFLASNISQKLADLIVDPNLDLNEELNGYEKELRFQFGIKGPIKKRSNILLRCYDNFSVNNTTKPLQDLMQITHSISRNFYPGGFKGLQSSFYLKHKSRLLEESLFSIYALATEVSLLKTSNENLMDIQQARHLHRKLMNETVVLTSLNVEYYKATDK